MGLAAQINPEAVEWVEAQLAYNSHGQIFLSIFSPTILKPFPIGRPVTVHPEEEQFSYPKVDILDIGLEHVVDWLDVDNVLDTEGGIDHGSRDIEAASSSAEVSPE